MKRWTVQQNGSAPKRELRVRGARITTRIIRTTSQVSQSKDSTAAELDNVTRVVDSGNGEISVTYSAIKDRAPSHCLLIAHGVRGSMNSPIVKYFHAALAANGFLTVRFNFPYTEGRLRLLRRPDKREALVECYRKVIDDVRNSRWHPRNLILGGISLGAAVASHVVSDGPDIPDVKGLFFLNYPLHKPGNSEARGDKHLAKIQKPMLFVAGTRDFYAEPKALRSTLSTLGTRASIHWVEGGDHAFNRGKGKGVHKATLQEIVDVLTGWANSTQASTKSH